jgi:hypothetical protein
MLLGQTDLNLFELLFPDQATNDLILVKEKTATVIEAAKMFLVQFENEK